MLIKKIKNFIKLNFPFLTKKLIEIRDTNSISKKINNHLNFHLVKEVHGKKIVKEEEGFIIDKTKNNFVSYTLRPKKTENIITESDVYNDEDSGIIIQGSLKGVEKFVEQTIDLYLKLFQKTEIVLSIWENEIKYFPIQKYKDKIKIIINKIPKNESYNVNLQMISTYNALQYLIEKKTKYCLKTRTDCRIHNKNSLNHLKNLLKIFPIHDKYKHLQSRIISSSIDTRKYRVYGLSDIFIFGETINLYKYFKFESYTDSLKENFGEFPCIIKDTAVINEIYLCARYLKNSNINLDWELKEWWKLCGEIFCVVDASDFDLFWYKYDWKFEQRFIQNYTTDSKQALNFSDWINLYNNQSYQFDENKKEKWKLKDGIIVQ